jgi:hypothetical protein
MVSTLWELSVTAVVNSFESICIKSREENSTLTVMSFPDVFLPPAVADTLLDVVLNRKVTGDPFMWLHPFFDTKRCRLTRVVLPRLEGCRSRRDFRCSEQIVHRLAQHSLLELSVDPHWCSSQSILDTLSEKNPNIASLKVLSLRNVKPRPINRSKFLPNRPKFLPLAHLHHLRCLNLSGTEIGHDDMNYLLKRMTGLEILELAQTSLWLDKLDLSPVAQTISYLNFKDVFQCCVEECPPSFYSLPVLRHLDVGHLYKSPKWSISDDLIDAVIAMPSLTSVDFSCTNIQRTQIERLISAKGPKLKFLGLFESSLDLGEDIYPDYLTVR